MRAGPDDNTGGERSGSPSGALVLEVGLLHAPAEGQQVAVALDPLRQLRAGQPGGQDGEEVAEHQRVQLRGPDTHTHIVTEESVCSASSLFSPPGGWPAEST